jgi:hypothetical protein
MKIKGKLDSVVDDTVTSGYVVIFCSAEELARQLSEDELEKVCIIKHENPTEQKEYQRPPCTVCGKRVCGCLAQYKPIPAEKKECEHEYGEASCGKCGELKPFEFKCMLQDKYGKCTLQCHSSECFGLLNCEYGKPEPKPKDRIEPLKGDWVTDNQAISKLCAKVDEIIEFINNRKE